MLTNNIVGHAAIPNPPTCAVYLAMVSEDDCMSICVLIRYVTGLSLVEAKMLFDTLNPDREGGTFGPIATDVPIEEADTMMCLANIISSPQLVISLS